MNHLTDNAFTAYVGIDWADSKHDICMQATGGQRKRPRIGIYFSIAT